MPYTEKYESTLMRGDEDPRPWDLHSAIVKLIPTGSWILDIGCGTAYKSIKLAEFAHAIMGLEPNVRMRNKARDNIAASGCPNVVVVGGRADSLPFHDETFDMVTAMVAPHDTREVARVLKRGGCAVIEKIGDRDKWNIKSQFSPDDEGPRGQFGQLREGERVELFRGEFDREFSRVEIGQGFWNTYYTTEGLELMLEQTPTVRNFDMRKDSPVVRRIVQMFATERGVMTQQNRILIRAWK